MQRAAETLLQRGFCKVPNTALFITWSLIKKFELEKTKHTHQVHIAGMKISLEGEGRGQSAVIMAS